MYPVRKGLDRVAEERTGGQCCEATTKTLTLICKRFSARKRAEALEEFFTVIVGFSRKKSLLDFQNIVNPGG